MSWLVPALVVGFLVSIPVFVAAGYYWGIKYQPQDRFAAYNQELSDHRELVIQTQDDINANLDVFTHRLGLLQAHANRLNALGSKMVTMADLDQGEFDFMNVPAMGGSNEDLGAEGYVSKDLTALVEKLELSLLEKQQQLEILEDMIFSKNLNDDIQPRGKPVTSGWVSSTYGYRTDPFHGRRQFHHGIDFAGKKGSPIVAAASGVVMEAGKNGQYGNFVEIDHKNGYVSRYAHANELLVTTGDVVKKGQEIAKMGSTGRSTGTHLHFEVMKEGKRINPLRLLKKSKS